MKKKDITENSSKKKRKQSSVKVLLDGLLMVAAAVAVFYAYHWLHRDNERQVIEEPENTMIRREAPASPLSPVEEKTAEPSSPSSGATIEFLYMGHGSGERGDDSDSGSQSDLHAADSRGRQEQRGRQQSPSAGDDSPPAPERPEYSDSEPPRVLSIAGFPEKVAPGSDVEIQVRARDNLSGVRSISGSIQSPSGKASLPFGCSPTGDLELFLATVRVPERAEMGPWTVKSLRLTDNVHNTRRYQERDTAISGGVFQVVDSDSDSVPPELTAFTVEPREAQGGEKVRIFVTVKDEKSAVTRAIGTFVSPSGNARISFSCREKRGGETLTGEVSLPQDAESGDWVLSYVRVEDEAKNTQNFYPKDHPDALGDAVIRIYAAGSDSQPPSLEDISIGPPAVAYQEKVEISIMASDDLSGISHVAGRIRSPSGQAFIPFTCTYDSYNDVYRAEIQIKNNTEVGTWRVEYVRMQDEARNQAVYSYQSNAYVKDAVFEVTGE